MEYIIDKNYPGYFLSSEPKNVGRFALFVFIVPTF